MPRFSVRYSSSLYANEMAERATATAARDTPWYFNNLCVVIILLVLSYIVGKIPLFRPSSCRDTESRAPSDVLG